MAVYTWRGNLLLSSEDSQSTVWNACEIFTGAPDTGTYHYHRCGFKIEEGRCQGVTMSSVPLPCLFPHICSPFFCCCCGSFAYTKKKIIFFILQTNCLFFPLCISSRVQLGCLAFWLATQAVPKSLLGRRSWPLQSTTDWRNKRPTQGAQITLHPCLSSPKCLWRAQEEADDPASRAALNSVLQTPFKPPTPFPTVLQILKSFTQVLVYNGPHSSQQVRNTVCWHLKRFSRHSSAVSCLWTVPSLLRALLLWGQTLTLRGEVVTCNAAVGCQ